MIYKGEERGICASVNFRCGFLEPFYLNIPANPEREKIKIVMFVTAFIKDITVYLRLGERFTEKPPYDPYDMTIKDFFVLSYRDVNRHLTVFEDESTSERSCYRGAINIAITSLQEWGGSTGILSILEL